MFPTITRRRFVRAAAATGVAGPLLLRASPGNAAPAHSSRGINITREDEVAFARKFETFQRELSRVDRALLRLTTDNRNYGPGPSERRPQTQPEDFSGQKVVCTCTVAYDDEGFVLIQDPHCPYPGHGAF